HSLSSAYPPGANVYGSPGNYDVAVSELNPSGSALLFATYLGGTRDDDPAALALDGSGNVYVAGATFSSGFPTLNAYQPTYDGGSQGPGAAAGFPVQLDAQGHLALRTFLGGPGADAATAVAVQGGHAYVAGSPRKNDLRPLFFPFSSPQGERRDRGA